MPYARSFSELTDFSVWEEYIRYGVEESIDRLKPEVEDGKFDEQLVQEIISAYAWEYGYQGGENLSVKNSATSIMKDAEGFAEEYPSEQLFTEEDERFDLNGQKIGKEVGIAYHAFLEHFDFSKIKGVGTRETLLSTIEDDLVALKNNGTIDEETIKLLSKEKLADILSLPVFESLHGARLYKERQFLVSLPIEHVPALKERAMLEGNESILAEELLFQGAIDLLAVFTDGSARIIDYKFSVKNQMELKEKYGSQLDLYKKATARILKIDEANIRCSIVNLLRGFEISL